MVGLVIEFSLVVVLFWWLHRRQVLARNRARRVRPLQLHFDIADSRRATRESP